MIPQEPTVAHSFKSFLGLLFPSAPEKRAHDAYHLIPLNQIPSVSHPPKAHGIKTMCVIRLIRDTRVSVDFASAAFQHSCYSPAPVTLRTFLVFVFSISRIFFVF